MRIEGSPKQWSDFLSDLIPDILLLVIKTWGKYKKPDDIILEVPINKWFAERMRQEKNKQGDLPFKICPEVSIPDPNTGKELGRIDILFDPVYTINEHVYFAFECKRLHIIYDKRMETNTGEYIGDDGMMCFITGKYSEELPSGGMIGYVMDGDVYSAILTIKKAIKKQNNTLCLCPNTSLEDCSLLPNEKQVKETKHKINNDFTIYHVFLAV